MADMETFYSVNSINLEKIRKDISIPVIREPLIPKNHKTIESQFDIVLAQNKNGVFKRVDEVPRKCPFVDFTEVHDWINIEFDRIGLKYKLRKSVIEKRKMSLYQEYIFNKEVITPDGEGIAPMVMVKASHSRSGSPLELHLGTYRFSCANGAIVTVGDMTSIKITEANWNIYTDSKLHKMFIQLFDQYNLVSELYMKLAQIKANDVFDTLFSDKLISLRLRKKVLEKLEMENQIEITANFNDPIINRAMLKSKYLTHEMLVIPKNSISLNNNNMTLWDIYNDFTEQVTHSNKTSTGMLCGSKAVNHVFKSMIK